MSLSNLVNRARSQLQQRKEQTSQVLTTAHSQTVQQIKPQLDHLYQQIDAKQSDQPGDVTNKIPLSWLSEGGKLDALKQFIYEHIDRFATFARVTTEQVMQWASSLSQQSADLLMRVAQAGFIPELPNVSGLLSTAVNKMAGLFGTLGKDAAKGVGYVLTLGLSMGSSIKELAIAINQTLDVPRWRSIAIAATELFRIFNDTLMIHYRGNQPTIIGWLWQCKLSPKSCVACVALHNTLHKLTETLVDHPSGECVPIPYTSTQAIGQSGTAWFEEQSEEIQREIFGTQVAFDLWKSGTPLEAFIGVDHDHEYGDSVYQKSVKQIRRG
jgi:hypothetical protein